MSKEKEAKIDVAIISHLVNILAHKQASGRSYCALSVLMMARVQPPQRQTATDTLWLEGQVNYQLSLKLLSSKFLGMGWVVWRYKEYFSTKKCNKNET